MNFYDHITEYSNATAFITDGSGQFTYKELLHEADVFKRHIKERCLIFCLCDNCIESLVGYIGFLRGRVVPLLLNSNISLDLLQKLIETYKPEYIWLPREKAAVVEGCQEIYAFQKYILAKTKFSIDYKIHDDLALLLTTSGSTGSPKLVRQSYKNITANANSIVQYLQISSVDRPITTLPMSYTYGLSILNSHLLKGASIVLTTKSLFDRSFWELIKTNKATTFGGVPYIYEMLKKLRFLKMDLSSIKVLTQAGGKLNKSLAEEFATQCKAKGIDFIMMYGQTEATARMSYLPVEYSITKAGSIGIPIPGGEFWIEDSQGNIISESNVDGELMYKGDNVTLGYAMSCYDLSKGDENGGILKTGDVARRDVDGFYYITGRKKRFLKLFGNRVNLDDIEQMLKEQGYDCACTGEDDNLKIFITRLDKQQEVKSFITGKTGIPQSGIKIMYMERIPRNEVGKILYADLELMN